MYLLVSGIYIRGHAIEISSNLKWNIQNFEKSVVAHELIPFLGSPQAAKHNIDF